MTLFGIYISIYSGVWWMAGGFIMAFLIPLLHAFLKRWFPLTEKAMDKLHDRWEMEIEQEAAAKARAARRI
jgi:hypothetical protein